MKLQGLFLILMLAAALGGTAMAQTSSDTAFSQVVVSRVVLDPQVPMVGDTGTITVTVQNTGTEAVEINRATLYADGVNLLNSGAYDSLITLGPGNTRDFTFFVTATGQPGLYQPRFYLDFLGSGFLSYLIPLRIDNTPLQVSVVSTPDFFASGRDDQVTLRVGNPRGSNLTGVTIVPSGTGVRTIQSSYFVGDIGPGASTQVTFDVIPSMSTTLDFQTSYQNGINTHTTDTSVPILVDNSRRSADLVINDVKLTPSGGSYQLDGDITNGGLDDAKSVVVTVGSPATPADPYPSYVIGTLAVDDFSSFSVTFSGPALTSVPVLVTWKDSDGNSYQNTVEVNLRTAAIGSGTGTAGARTAAGGGGGGGPFGFFGGGRGGLQIPFIPIIVIIVIMVVLAVAWRKGVFDRFTKKGKGKQGNQQDH
ncbi:MAG TPA: CARDB domain-containing protein [Methanomicrobiales archaeon]|nr:CARDB domain-containing protein [Methanomicrobiales archaeon]